jgi:hypothetical protein
VVANEYRIGGLVEQLAVAFLGGAHRLRKPPPLGSLASTQASTKICLTLARFWRSVCARAASTPALVHLRWRPASGNCGRK